MMKNALAMLLLLALVQFSFASDASRIAQENEVQEAVFGYQFDHNASGLQKKANVYCLFIGPKRTDPSNELIKRFASHTPPVRKASECKIGAGGVFDKRTRAEGLAFGIFGITWTSDTEAQVEGGYYEAALSSSKNTYTVVKQQGAWKVSKDSMKWISRNLKRFSIPYC